MNAYRWIEVAVLDFFFSLFLFAHFLRYAFQVHKQSKAYQLLEGKVVLGKNMVGNNIKSDLILRLNGDSGVM